jgi:hypothetical protein
VSGQVPLFDDHTPILSLGRDTTPYIAGKSRSVLWPAFGYRVTAHLPQARKLNMFVRYVLRMFRAGVRTSHEIGEALCLSPELVKFVVEGAVQQGWMTTGGVLTRTGETLLDEDAAGAVESKVGWLFRDAFDGTLWHRFVPDGEMQRADGTLNVRNRYAEVIVGKRTIKSTVLSFSGSPPSAPSTREIGEALRQGHRAQSLHQMLKDGDTAIEPDDTLFSGVLQDEFAQPYFLLTSLFYPEDDTLVATWMIADPFGYGIDTRMRELADSLDARSGLQREIDRLNENVNWPSGSKMAGVEERKELQLAGREVVDSTLKGLREVQPDAYNLMVGAASAALRLHRDQGASGGSLNKGAWLSEQKRFLWQLYAGVEVLTGETARSIYIGGILHALSDSRAENAHFLREQARQLGFYVDHTKEEAKTNPARDPERVLNTISGKAHAVGRYGDNDLPSTLAHLILAVRRGDALPFRHAPQEMPGLLGVLAELKARRGDVAHAGDPWFGTFDPMSLLKDVLEACRYLGPVPFQSGAWVPDAALAQAEGVRQSRARRRRAISLEHERSVGRTLRRMEKVAEELLDAALIIDELQAADPGASIAIRPLDAAIHLSNVLEVLWRRVLAALPAMPEERSLPLNDRVALGARVAAAARDLGFELPEDPRVLEAVTRVKGERIRIAIRRREQIASAAIATTLLAGAHSSSASVVKQLAVADSGLIVTCCELLNARGHGDISDLTTDEIVSLYQRTLVLTRTMIEVLEPTAREHDREEAHA